MSALTTAPDLTREFPRSPAQELGGYVLLARAVDKCRATVAGTNGEYNYDCPMDKRFFDFSGIDSGELKELVAKGASDEEIAQWVKQHAHGHSEEELLTWNFEQRNRGPQTPVEKAHFEHLRLSACPDSYYVNTWMQVLDSEEGRFPKR